MLETVVEPDTITSPSAETPVPEPEGVNPEPEGSNEIRALRASGSTDSSRLAAMEDRLGRTTIRRDGWTLSIFVFSAIALVAAVVGVGLGSRAVDESKRNAARGAPSQVGTGAPATASVTLSDFAISPKDLRVADGGSLKVSNVGNTPHNLVLSGKRLATRMIEDGGSDTLKLTGIAPGTYTVICEVPGHEAAGMVATLHVLNTTGSASAASGAVTPTATPSADAAIDFSKTPGPDWRAFDPTLKPAEGAAVHNVTSHATETVIEIAPGVDQELWTFGGHVPGPTLRGHVGDVFNVTLVNDGKVGHSIDFHASKVSPNVAMRTLQSGESLVYQFKAEFAGIWMYHCGTAPALHHIGNGMYGTVVIDPPALPAVDHEYVMVQSELYLGPEGQPGDLKKMQAADPDAVVFNGYVNQYKFSPIKVEPGQRVRVWVLDAGPNENSSFHVVGTIFDTVFKEGQYLLRPDSTRGGSQSLDLQPAQGGFVEFTLTDPGQYPMVTHKFSNVGKGALGLFQVGQVPGTMGH